MKYKHLTVESFKAYAAKRNKPIEVTVHNKGMGGEEHWLVVGCRDMFIQWWPFSKKRTIFYEGITEHFLSIEMVWQISTRRSKNPTVRCGECGSLMVLRRSDKGKSLLGRNHNLFYGCSRYPRCKGTHSCHADGRPLGVPADQKTKAARIKAHDAFDQLWKEVGLTRVDAYKWLAEQLGIERKDCHIGRFDQEQCNQVVKHCSELLYAKPTLLNSGQAEERLQS